MKEEIFDKQTLKENFTSAVFERRICCESPRVPFPFKIRINSAVFSQALLFLGMAVPGDVLLAAPVCLSFVPEAFKSAALVCRSACAKT